MSETERKQLNLKIKRQKYDRWEEYQKDNAEYASMTDLVRQSVEKEIAGRDSPQVKESGSGREVAEMKDMITSLQGDIDMLSSVVSDLQKSIKSEPSDKHLRSEIFAAIPSEDSMQGPISADELAEELGPVDRNVVAKVLEDLADEVAIIERSFRGEETHYQKRE